MFNCIDPPRGPHSHGDRHFPRRARHFHLGRKFLCPEFNRAPRRPIHPRALAHWPGPLQHCRRSRPPVSSLARIRSPLKTSRKHITQAHHAQHNTTAHISVIASRASRRFFPSFAPAKESACAVEESLPLFFRSQSRGVRLLARIASACSYCSTTVLNSPR